MITSGTVWLLRRITKLEHSLKEAKADAKSWYEQCDDARDLALKLSSQLKKYEEKGK